MKQLTVRGFDEELTTRIKNLALNEGISLNQAVLRLLRKGANLEEKNDKSDVVGSSLDHMIGTWTEEEAGEIIRAIADFEEISST